MKQNRKNENTGELDKTAPEGIFNKAYKKFTEVFFRKSFWVYIICGIITTLSNLLMYKALESYFGVDEWLKYNIWPIIISILLAYVLNRVFVFESKAPVWPEILKFSLSRALCSLFFEYGVMYFFIDILNFKAELSIFGFSMRWAKLFAQIGVVLGNYLIGLLYVFKKKEVTGNKAEKNII